MSGNAFSPVFTPEVTRVIVFAEREAERLHQDYVGTEHLLLALIDDPSGDGSRALRQLDVDRAHIRGTIEQTARAVTGATSNPPVWTSGANKALELAIDESRTLGDGAVRPIHVLSGLVREQDGVAAAVLADTGVTLARARDAYRSMGAPGNRPTPGPPRWGRRKSDLREVIDPTDRRTRLSILSDDLTRLTSGRKNAEEYEAIVGDVIRLCFVPRLANVERKVRNVNGRVVRDWIAANVARSGFWEMVRTRYLATQIIWECKNVVDLDADAFYQMASYMTPQIGHLAVLCFRGEIRQHYYEHVRRAAEGQNPGGVVLLLTDRDLKTCIDLTRSGSTPDDHIQLIYDHTVRKIS